MSADPYPIQYVNAIQLAGIYARLGEPDVAVQWLAEAIRHPAGIFTAAYAAQYPKLIILHGNPKFEALIRNRSR